MEIACKFQNAHWQNGVGYIMDITSLKNIHPNTTLASLDGPHKEGYVTGNVGVLNVSKAEMHYVPIGLFQLFGNLKKLTIYYCSLEEITRRDLSRLKHLTELSITYCPLTKLPDDLFVETVELKTVDLRYNKIESASSKLLKPFTGRMMRLFDLRGNKTINAHYSQDEGSVKSLEELMKIIDEKCGAQENCEIVEKKNEPSPFEANIRSLWPSGRFSDFEVKAGLKTFRVHRNVLGLQSSVFAKVFDDNRQATDLKIPDFSETAVENLLHFLYTGEIKEESNVLEMFSIAAKLEVLELKKIYEKILNEKLKDSDELTAYEIFLCAHQNTSEELKAQAFTAIEKLFARDLPEDLMHNPRRLKATIEKKIELDHMLN